MLTKQDTALVQGMIDKAVEDISGVIADFASHVDMRFNALEHRQDKLEAGQQRLEIGQIKLENRIEKLEDGQARLIVGQKTMTERIDSIEAQLQLHREDFNRIYQILDKIERKLEVTEQEREVAAYQLKRIHAWAEKAAKKIGIPLIEA